MGEHFIQNLLNKSRNHVLTCAVSSFLLVLMGVQVSVAAPGENIPPSAGMPHMAVGPMPEFADKPRVNEEQFPMEVKSNGTTNLYEYFNVDEHCIPVRPNIKVILSPKFGKLTVKREAFISPGWLVPMFSFPKAGKIDERSSCHMREYPATSVIYEPFGLPRNNDIVEFELKDRGYVHRVRMFLTPEITVTPH
jgi:hypothetical protein